MGPVGNLFRPAVKKNFDANSGKVCDCAETGLGTKLHRNICPHLGKLPNWAVGGGGLGFGRHLTI